MQLKVISTERVLETTVPSNFYYLRMNEVKLFKKGVSNEQGVRV